MEALQQNEDSAAQPGAHGQPSLANDVYEPEKAASRVRGTVSAPGM